MGLWYKNVCYKIKYNKDIYDEAFAVSIAIFFVLKKPEAVFFFPTVQASLLARFSTSACS